VFGEVVKRAFDCGAMDTEASSDESCRWKEEVPIVVLRAQAALDRQSDALRKVAPNGGVNFLSKAM
jgi:hypothetical protein